MGLQVRPLAICQQRVCILKMSPAPLSQLMVDREAPLTRCGFDEVTLEFHSEDRRIP